MLINILSYWCLIIVTKRKLQIYYRRKVKLINLTRNATSVQRSPFEEFVERSAEGKAGTPDSNVFLQSEIFYLMFHAVFTKTRRSRYIS